MVGPAVPAVRTLMPLPHQQKADCSIHVGEHGTRVLHALAERAVMVIVGAKITDGPPAEIARPRR